MDSINLINFHKDKMVLNEEALQLIAGSNQFISVVSVCGEYRTGKSFLLNSLFSKNCFQVSPTTQACTKGINMMKQPIKYKNKNIWIFDTEGFGSLEQDGQHDAKIFLISMLISQVMIYNSLGAIDQISLSKIAMMCKKAQIIAKKTNNNQIEEAQSDYLNGNTKFYWILRDFALSLINKQGNTINADQYLQQAIHTTSNETQHKLIRNMFGERHCFPLIRPCITEQNIHTLKQIGDKSIRIEFLQQIKKLKSSILQNANPKKILNKKIKGPEFVQLIRCYVQMINEENFCTSLCLTWEQIQTHQRQTILQKIQEEIRKKYKQYEKMLPLGQDQMGRLEKQIRLILKQQTMSISHNQSSIKIIEESAQKINLQLKSKIIQLNSKKIRQKCLEYLSQYYQQLSNKLVSLANLSNFNQKFEGQIAKLKKNYFLRFSNYHSELIYQQYSVILQKLLNNLFRELIHKWCEDDSVKNRKLEELKKQKKVLELQLEQRLIIEQTLGKQIIITKKLYQQSIKNTNNYIEIIDRMERVSQNLRKQFQIIKQSQISLKHKLQLKIIQHEEKMRNHQLSQQGLLQQLQQVHELNRQKQMYIEALKNQIQKDRNYNEKEMKSKIEGLMTVLNNERQHFQNIMSQKNQQQQSVIKQLEQKQQIIFKIRQQFGESTSYLKAQFHQTITQMQVSHEARLKQKQNMMRQLYTKNEELTYKIQKLCVDMQNLGQEEQNKSNKIVQIKNKYKQLENKLSDKQCQFLHKLSQEQHSKNRLKKENEQLGQNIKQLEQKIHTIQKRNKQQLQAMCKKLEESLSNQEVNSKQKQEYLQKQYEVQREDIANKLTQAAERIEKMNIKQTKLTNKVHEYEEQIKYLKQSLIKYETETGQCKMCIQIQIKLRNLQNEYHSIVESSSQLQQIISIQQTDITKLKDKNKQLAQKVSIYGPMRQDQNRKNLQSCKQILKNQQIEQLKLQTRKEKDEKQRQRILWLKKQQSYMQIIQKMKEQKQNNKKKQLSNRNSNKKQQEQYKLSKSKNKQNPQNFGLGENWQGIGMTKEELQIKIQELSIENRRIKNELEEQRQTVDKLRKQSIKSINFHAFMKRNKIVDQQNEQNMENKKTINTNTMASIEFHEKLIAKQKVIDELLNKIDELINNQLVLNDKINEQRLALASQYEQLESIKQELIKQKQHTSQVKKSRQKIRNQLQSIKAQYHLTIQKLQKQIHILSKKYSNMSKETQLWKMKALQFEERSLLQSNHQNILYKQKIDSLFNKY